MNKFSRGVLSLGILLASSSALAGISPQEQRLYNEVKSCLSDIDRAKGAKPIDDMMPFTPKYKSLGGIVKYCGSAAEKTQKAIMPGHIQQEKWDEELMVLVDEYRSIPKSDLSKPYAVNLQKKIVAYSVPSKLDNRGASSKLMVYRQIIKDIDRLEQILPGLEGY